MNIEEEFLADQVEQKIKPNKRKKTINQKKKGNAGELELVHILNERFSPFTFKRNFSSGSIFGASNFEKNAGIDESIITALKGDIICPPSFLFSIEHKFYKEFNFWDLVTNEKGNLPSWIEQCQRDALEAHRKPLLIVKVNNHPRIVFITEKLKEYKFEYNSWYCTILDDFLKLPNEFFFKEK
jgi:hypothetical protein